MGIGGMRCQIASERVSLTRRGCLAHWRPQNASSPSQAGAAPQRWCACKSCGATGRVQTVQSCGGLQDDRWFVDKNNIPLLNVVVGAGCLATLLGSVVHSSWNIACAIRSGKNWCGALLTRVASQSLNDLQCTGLRVPYVSCLSTAGLRECMAEPESVSTDLLEVKRAQARDPYCAYGSAPRGNIHNQISAKVLKDCLGRAGHEMLQPNGGWQLVPHRVGSLTDCRNCCSRFGAMIA